MEFERKGTMDVGSAVMSALFVVLIVFSVLVLLWVMVRLFSAVILKIEKSAAERNAAENGGK
jgi:Na+-transporting methylmalonyl-CoA/oxaloacetate decarboxylase gamma subunit